jgi:serine/threonine protein kinase
MLFYNFYIGPLLLCLVSLAFFFLSNKQNDEFSPCKLAFSLVLTLILSEYMPEGNLYDFLHKQNDVLGLLLILETAIQISKGMEYLHQNRIIHRDLKTANILIGHNQVCILIQTFEAIGCRNLRVHCRIEPRKHMKHCNR